MRLVLGLAARLAARLAAPVLLALRSRPGAAMFRRMSCRGFRLVKVPVSSPWLYVLTGKPTPVLYVRAGGAVARVVMPDNRDGAAAALVAGVARVTTGGVWACGRHDMLWVPGWLR